MAEDLCSVSVWIPGDLELGRFRRDFENLFQDAEAKEVKMPPDLRREGWALFSLRLRVSDAESLLPRLIDYAKRFDSERLPELKQS